jgi:hypothetical protein
MRKVICLLVLVALASACMLPENKPKATTTTTLPCNESDAGRDYYAVGTASGFNGDKQTVSEADYCLNSDQLIESYCDEVGYVVTEAVSCKRIERVCERGVCVFYATTTTTTTTSTTTTQGSTTTTILGECVQGSCPEGLVFYRCRFDTVEGYVYTERVSRVFYCADAGTPDAKCKAKENSLLEDRCANEDEVCVDGLQQCQPKSSAQQPQNASNTSAG